MWIFNTNKFKWVKQHDSMQCGVSCLAMICRHYGKNYSLEYLDGFCHANIAGISMLGITDGAKSVGLNVMTVAASTDELNKIALPCILHWNQKTGMLFEEHPCYFVCSVRGEESSQPPGGGKE